MIVTPMKHLSATSPVQESVRRMWSMIDDPWWDTKVGSRFEALNMGKSISRLASRIPFGLEA